ncbi:hypothetical protein AA650_05085 [Anabaena sp. WA102]|nr:hypothetical protein AA650_05085 [Anabaena sp. WA102]OBQ18182.1 MAG: hypothetical protein AN486_12890 [Anabaena sp. AL93]
MPAPQEIFGYFFNWKSLRGCLKPTFSMSKYTQNIFPSRLFCQKKNFIKQLKPNHNNHFMLFAIHGGIQ